jgi:Family of unknown function (DUF6090)
MIKFFRRIRRKLLDEGNLKRYLLYAIGEILLVVMGILIAVQINNLNQNNSIKKELQTSYQNLYLDLKNDLIKFNVLYADLGKVIKSAESTQLLLLRKNNILDVSELRKIPRLWNPGLSYNNGTYQTLIGTGLLYKSRNENIILQINKYYLELGSLMKLMETMNNANRFARDREVLIPFQYIKNADETVFSPHVNSLLWMNDMQSPTYQAVQNYLSKSLSRQKLKQQFLNKLITMNESVQKSILLILDKK